MCDYFEKNIPSKRCRSVRVSNHYHRLLLVVCTITNRPLWCVAWNFLIDNDFCSDVVSYELWCSLVSTKPDDVLSASILFCLYWYFFRAFKCNTHPHLKQINIFLFQCMLMISSLYLVFNFLFSPLCFLWLFMVFDDARCSHLFIIIKSLLSYWSRWTCGLQNIACVCCLVLVDS